MPGAWLRAGEQPEAQRALLRAVATERFRSGSEDLAPLSNELLEASRTVGGADAVGLATLAVAASPSESRPRLRLAWLALSQRLAPSVLIRNLWAAAVAAASDPWVQVRLAARIAGILWAGALIAALALATAALPGRAPLLFHDYSDAFPKPVRRVAPATFAAVATVAAVGGGGVGPLFLAGLLALGLAGYLRPQGRWALGVSLSLACLLYPSVPWGGRFSGAAGERAWALYRVAKGDAGPALGRVLADGPGAESVPFLVARSLVARRAHRYAEAAAYLERARAAGGPEAALRLELGNLFFIQGRYDEAAIEYERAAAADPRDALPWLNLHVVQLKRLALAEADHALEKAKELNTASSEALRRAQGGESAPLVPISTGLPSAWVREALWCTSGAGATWAGELWQGLVLPLPWVHPAVLGGLSLLGVWALGTRGRERLSRRCPTCGTAVCPRCGRRVKGTDHCPPCWAVFGHKPGDSAERARRQQVMASWSVRAESWRRVGRVVLPGWGALAYGGGPRDLAVGVAWSLGWGAVLLWALYPVPTLPWGTVGVPWIGGALVGLLHVDGLRRTLAGPPRPGRG